MRPDGWDALKIIDAVYEERSGTLVPESALVEAGADAYEEGIWEMARKSPTGVFVFDSNTHQVY